jgi:ABC-type polysaccharide/polyol phosphate export permease
MFLYLDTPVEPMDPTAIVYLVLFVVFCIGAFLLRNTIFGFLWVIVKAFFIALAITIVAGRIKGSIKDMFKD